MFVLASIFDHFVIMVFFLKIQIKKKQINFLGRSLNQVVTEIKIFACLSARWSPITAKSNIIPTSPRISCNLPFLFFSTSFFRRRQTTGNFRPEFVGAFLQRFGVHTQVTASSLWNLRDFLFLTEMYLLYSPLSSSPMIGSSKSVNP